MDTNTNIGKMNGAGQDDLEATNEIDNDTMNDDSDEDGEDEDEEDDGSEDRLIDEPAKKAVNELPDLYGPRGFARLIEGTMTYVISQIQSFSTDVGPS